MSILIDLKILDDRLRSQFPAYATPGSAGLDLRAALTLHSPCNRVKPPSFQPAWRFISTTPITQR